MKTINTIFNGEQFSGVAIGFSDCTVSNKMRVDRGVYVGDYEGDLIKINEEQMLVNFSYLEEEEHGPDVPFMYDGRRFSGIAFEFHEGICIGEHAYENGWRSDSVSYRSTGELANFDLMENGFAQRADFYEGGKLKSIYLFEKELFHTTFAFDEIGNVTVINIEGSYFDNIKNYRDRVKCLVPESKKLAHIKGADFVKLSGEEVDDEVFSSLCEIGLTYTSKLWIWRTQITAVSISMLTTLKSLKELNVESEILVLDEIKKFKSQCPDCFVEFNREEVKA